MRPRALAQRVGFRVAWALTKTDVFEILQHLNPVDPMQYVIHDELAACLLHCLARNLWGQNQDQINSVGISSGARSG